MFVEGRVTSCKRVNYPAGYRGENSIKVIAHLFLLLLLNQPLTWSPNFFLVRIFPKSSPGQRPWLRPSNCFNFMQMRRRMNEQKKIQHFVDEIFFSFGLELFETDRNGRRQHCVPPSYRRGRMSVSRFSRSRSVWRGPLLSAHSTGRSIRRPCVAAPLLGCHFMPQNDEIIIKTNLISN